MHGFVVGTKWFAQKIERAYFGKNPRRFDIEKNKDISDELIGKIDELQQALEMGVGVQDACVEIGMRVNMIAMNDEMRKGKDPEPQPEPEPVKEEVVAFTPDVTVPVDKKETAAPVTTTPPKKLGRPPKTKSKYA